MRDFLYFVKCCTVIATLCSIVIVTDDLNLGKPNLVVEAVKALKK